MDTKKILLLVFILSVLSFFTLLILDKESYLYEAPLHIGLFSIALYFLWNKDLKTTLHELGVPGDLKTNLAFSLSGFLAIMASLFILAYIMNFFGINDQSKIADIVDKLPLYLLILAILFAPFSEELFFRGLLVRRFGILPAAALFSILHISYGSAGEIIGAFAIGVILGLIYKQSKSILPPIIVHMTYNLLAIAIMRSL
jgi:membrane protease YdiL (CAAX protease family)